MKEKEIILDYLSKREMLDVMYMKEHKISVFAYLGKMKNLAMDTYWKMSEEMDQQND